MDIQPNPSPPPPTTLASRTKHTLRRLIFLRPVGSDRLKNTAWLDGLRGFAALLVYFHHHQLWVHNAGNASKWFENSYGYEGEHYLAAFHGIRTFFSGGHYAVATFYVISGYVLSLRPLSHVHAGEYDKLAQALSSALFRRWIRLYLPVIGTTLLWLTSWHALGWWCKPFEPQPTYALELQKWWWEIRQYMFLHRLSNVGFPWLYWNLHTWSIPYEFKGSLFVYTVSLGLAGQTRNARLLLVSGLICYLLYMVDGWYLAMFLSGLLLCDLDLLSADNNLPRFLTHFEPYKRFLFTELFLVSVYFGGVPLAENTFENLQKSPGWKELSILKPEAVMHHKWFFLFWAATFLVAAVPRLPWLKAFFVSRACQYLGRVSYALYLMHGPVIWSLGHVVYLAAGWPKDEQDYMYPWFYKRFELPRVGPMGFEPAFWIPQLVLLPATLWVANVVTVLIDEPSVRFAAWARNKTLAGRSVRLPVDEKEMRS